MSSRAFAKWREVYDDNERLREENARMKTALEEIDARAWEQPEISSIWLIHVARRGLGREVSD